MPAAESEFHWGTGRRKTAVARVRMRRGTGRMTVNGRSADEYFVTDRTRASIRAPMRLTKTVSKFDVFANIRGGGMSAQADAMLDQELHQRLKDEGFLTRDSREKERKKYGRRGARAGFQFSKR